MMKKLLGSVLLLLTLTTPLFTQEKVIYPDIVLFTQPNRCPPCRTMEPIISNLGKNFNIVKVLVDSEQNITRLHGVSSIPTILILKEGKEISRFVGAQSEATIRESLKKR